VRWTLARLRRREWPRLGRMRLVPKVSRLVREELTALAGPRSAA
jgi:hypothetical protein